MWSGRTSEGRAPIVGTRRQIIEVFWRQAVESGIRSVNVKSLMAEVGMNRTTFYDNFDSIDEVIRVSEDQIIEDLLEGVSRIGSEVKAKDIFDNLSRILPRYGRRIAILLSSNGDPAFLERIRSTMAPAIFAMLGMDEDQEVLDRIVLFVTSALTGVMSEGLAKGYGDETLAEELFKMDRLIFHGLAQFTDRDPFADMDERGS